MKPFGFALIVALAVPCVAASAQEVATKPPFNVQLGGYFNDEFGTVTTADRYNPSARSNAFRYDASLFVDAHATADNGLLYGISLRQPLESDSSALEQLQQRALLYFQADWGRLELGKAAGPAFRSFGFAADYGPPYLDAEGPSAYPIGWHFLPGADGRNPPSGLGNALSIPLASLGVTPFDFQTAAKLYYSTPEIAGVQISFAYIPDGGTRGIVGSPDRSYGDAGSAAIADGASIGIGEAGGCRGVVAGAAASVGLNASNGVCATTELSQAGYNDAVEGAVQYRTDFSTADVKAVIGFTHASAKGQLANPGVAGVAGGGKFHDLTSIAANLSVSYAGFTGTLGVSDEGLSGQLQAGSYHSASYGLGAGLEYAIAGWTIGGFWRYAEQAGSTFLPGADRLEDTELGIGYKLRPGVKLWGDVYHLDYRDDGALLGDGAGSVDHRTAYIFMTGSSISF